MENLLPWRVLKEPLITGAYNSFAVDILESDATYRGYICGMENGQRLCMVRVGSMQQLQVVSIEQLRLVDGSLVFHPETFTEEIDVLVTVQQNRPESWQAGRIVGGVEGDGYLLANVEVNLSDDSVQRYLVLDGPGAAFRRIRRRGHLGPPVTKLSFRHATIPVDSLRLRSAGLTATLTTIQWIPQFRSLFLMQTGEIMFLGVENDRVAVLVAENTETDVTNDEIATSVLRAIYWYSKKSVLAAEFTARSIVEEILCITVAQQALDDPSENRFLGLYKELHVSVFAYLNVYDQHRLRRTCRWFQHLLFEPTVRQCVILPWQSKHAAKPAGLCIACPNNFQLAQIIGNCVTCEAKVLYITGNWEKSLSPLTAILKVMHVKLDWLVIVDDFVLSFNEFLIFPKPLPMLHIEDFIVIRRNNFSASDYPDYDTICHHIMLKNCYFSSELAICFAGVLSIEDGESGFFCPCERLDLKCCHDPFAIRILRWQHHFTKSSTSAFEPAFQSALEECCPILEKNEIESFVNWLDSLTNEDMEVEKCIWPFILLSYQLWNEEPPTCLEDVKRDAFNVFAQKRLMMQTLTLLVPAANVCRI